MKESPMSNLKNKLAGIINSGFIVLVFALPFVSFPFILNANKSGKELFLITVVSLWVFAVLLTRFKNKEFKIYTVDVVLLLFVSYVFIHYLLFSFYSFFYDQFWVFMSYIVLFYVFQNRFDSKTKPDAAFGFTLKLIWLYSFVEAVMALLQKMNVVNGDSQYFEIVGTFTNPNFLGVYMVVGLLVTGYQLLFFQYQNTIVKLLLLVSTLLMSYVLYLTDSRASWVSLLVGILFLLGTSSKSISWCKANRAKAITAVSVLFLVFISGLYFLYQFQKDSVDGRTLIRKITITAIEEKPVFGNGIFNFAGIYNTTKADYFNKSDRPWEEIKVANYVSTSFNDYLQIIFEIGIIGLLLLGMLLYLIIRKIELNFKTRLGLSLLLAFAILGLFTSVLYNPTAMVFVVWALSVLFVYGNNSKVVVALTNRFFMKTFSIIWMIFSLIITLFLYFKIQALIDFKTISEGNDQRFYYKLSDNSMAIIEDDPFMAFKFGLEKFQEGEGTKGISMMEKSIKKAPIPDANLALGNLYVSLKNMRRAEELLVRNVGIEPFRFEPRENLLRFYIATKQNEKVVKTANEIIDLPIKMDSEKVKAYKENALKIRVRYDKAKP